jgi:hypothetical protein
MSQFTGRRTYRLSAGELHDNLLGEGDQFLGVVTEDVKKEFLLGCQ